MIVKPHRRTGPFGRAGIFPAQHLNAGPLPNGGRGSDYCAETARRWMASTDAATDAAVIARATELHRTPPVELPGPDVCHTPGGGPLNVPPSEAAPSRTWHPPVKVSKDLSGAARRAARKREAKSLPVADVMEMARHAAASALQGKTFKDHRDDCRSEILAAIMERVPDAGAARYPSKFCGYGWMVQRAADYRRKLEGDARRDLEQAARDAQRLSSPAVVYTLEDQRTAAEDREPGTVDAPPVVARRRAVAMLRALGMLGDREPVRWGPVWTVAYSAARIGVTVDDLGRTVEADAADVADELELTPATYRQHVKRAPERFPAAAVERLHTCYVTTDAGQRAPFFSTRAWRDALSLPTDDAGRAVKPSKSRSTAVSARKRDTSGRTDGWRGLDAARPAPGPVAVERQRIRRGNPTPPVWARQLAALRPRTAARMERDAEARRATARNRTPDERAAIRLALNLSPVPSRPTR